MSPSSSVIQSGGWVGCSYNWYRLFDQEDYRITKGVRHQWQYNYQVSYNGFFYYPEGLKEYYASLADGNTYQYATDYQCLAFTTKYSDVTDNSTDYTDSSWPFLRYADVLLIYAEAQNELGVQNDAITYLNLIRKRSNAELMDAYPGQDAMRSAIIEERAKEFACEADRRWDLIRWGIYLDAMNAVMYDDAGIHKERSERNLLFPIPQEEINSNTEINTNNPGWN
ncbi:MAG: RagB/SusD family nutrient uptake outer membrane protein [Bacteroidales bacterium]|nr:RagB/SusD family nutrient uptake outer membrane protein [Bacteroidales bacterium]